MILQAGRPSNCEGREAREVRTYDVLDALGIEYSRLDNAVAETMEVCREIERELVAQI